jgi:hypothetical protein
MIALFLVTTKHHEAPRMPPSLSNLRRSGNNSLWSSTSQFSKNDDSQDLLRAPVYGDPINHYRRGYGSRPERARPSRG